MSRHYVSLRYCTVLNVFYTPEGGKPEKWEQESANKSLNCIPQFFFPFAFKPPACVPRIPFPTQSISEDCSINSYGRVRETRRGGPNLAAAWHSKFSFCLCVYSGCLRTPLAGQTSCSWDVNLQQFLPLLNVYSFPSAALFFPSNALFFPWGALFFQSVGAQESKNMPDANRTSENTRLGWDSFQGHVVLSLFLLLLLFFLRAHFHVLSVDALLVHPYQQPYRSLWMKALHLIQSSVIPGRLPSPPNKHPRHPTQSLVCCSNSCTVWWISPFWI